MSLDELKVMFPDYHPEDYIFSVAACCGSCKKGVKKTYCIECQGCGGSIEMFPYGYCPQYERDPDIKMPVVMQWIVNNPFGNGEG